MNVLVFNLSLTLLYVDQYQAQMAAAAQVFPLQRDLLVEEAERLSRQYREVVDGVFPPSDAR